jgi:hypothetical protein
VRWNAVWRKTRSVSCFKGFAQLIHGCHIDALQRSPRSHIAAVVMFVAVLLASAFELTPATTWRLPAKIHLPPIT